MRVPGIPYVQGRNDYTDRDGNKYGIAIHNTSNDASDEGEASYATRRTDGISSHFYVDNNSVTQSIDTNDRVGHAGSNTGNENAIAVEITGGNGKSRQWWIDNVAWDKLAAVLAYVIKNDPDFEGFQIRRASVAEMKSNPRVKAFYGHNDMRLAWGGTTHTDPGENFPWDHLIAKVKQAANQSPVEDDMTEAEVIKAVQKALQTSMLLPGAIGERLKAKGWNINIAPWTVLGYMMENYVAGDSKVIAAVENVDEEVLKRLQAGDPTETAKLLKAVLGDNAEAVFQAGLNLPTA